jgi:hypothetical protein
MSDDKRTILVYGNSQAEAVALVFKSLPAISSEFRVCYVPEESAGADLPADYLRRCAILCAQQPATRLPVVGKLPKKVMRIHFPVLEFYLLWPFNCVNPFDVAEARYPFGHFPYGDSFIVNCIRRDLTAEAIGQYYSPVEWPATWPNLDKLFQLESARLSALDACHDVKIGSFILKYFRRKQLFCAPKNPSNTLLAELVYRLLHVCFGSDQPAERSDIEDLLSSFGPGELLGALCVPIHPLVAKHFSLEWYRANDRYAYFGRELTHDQYFSEMIKRSLICKNAALAK